MSTANMSLIDAVGYLRCSGDSQEEASIPDQQKHVSQYAAEKGYRILRWYIEVVSGDDTKNRIEFRRMMSDATELGDFKAILCWNQDRFGRFDSIEAGKWIHPLREAGIRLVTVNDGPIDWNDFAGRILYQVKQEGKHEFLKDLSRNILRGQLEAINNGSWVGRPPYAYRVVGPKKKKRLVLGDPGQVRVVQRIFREYVEEGRSPNEIAARLNAEGFVMPNGWIPNSVVKGRKVRWEFGTVKLILLNPAYCGDFAGNRNSTGKYNRIADGKVVKREGNPNKPRGKDRHKPKQEWTVRRDNHEAIIDRPTWEQAQTLLARGKGGRNQHTPEANPYIFTGLLRCGKCGCPLWGTVTKKTKTGKPCERTYYECRNRKHNGEGACEGTTVREDAVLYSIAEHLEREFFSLDGDGLAWKADRKELARDDLPEAFARVKALVNPPDRPGVDRKRLEKRSAQLGADIDKARRNLALLDPEFIPDTQEQIRRWQAERKELEVELRRKPPSEKDINTLALEVLRSLYWMGYYFRVAAQQSRYTAEQLQEFAWQAADELGGTLAVSTLDNPALALRPYLRKIAGITIHTTRRGGKKVTKRATWTDGRGVRRYAEREVVCGSRHIFRGGEILFRGIVGDKVIL
jgi:DNA invertase Pin-like site-specific DNA recombinase